MFRDRRGDRTSSGREDFHAVHTETDAENIIQDAHIAKDMKGARAHSIAAGFIAREVKFVQQENI